MYTHTRIRLAFIYAYIKHIHGFTNLKRKHHSVVLSDKQNNSVLYDLLVDLKLSSYISNITIFYI